MCSGLMVSIPGDSLNEKNGVTLRCENAECPTFENVYGHGKNEATAYEIACLKFIPDSAKKRA